MKKRGRLIEGVDYYIDPETKKIVLTEKFLKDRGTCCHGNCRHCPYAVDKRKREEKKKDNEQIIQNNGESDGYGS